MKLPRWLVVLVVIIVVLQVASCGVGALRMDEVSTPEGIPEQLQEAAPEPPPIDLADVSACEPIPASRVIRFAAACRVTIDEAAGSVRRLALENVGPRRVTITLTTDSSKEQRLSSGDSEDVDVPPNEPIEIDLGCPRPPGPDCAVRLGR